MDGDSGDETKILVQFQYK